MKTDIAYSDFEKLDIRVGLITAASAPDWSEKLIRYEIDLGEEIGKRILFSGIRKWITPEELIGKKVPVVVNMAPKKMGDEESAGMAVMVDAPEKPVMIYLPEDLPVGCVIR
jgi:methionyl-tRNA synthetase